MKKILLFTLLPFFANAEGIDKKIDQAFKPISDFFQRPNVDQDDHPHTQKK